MPRWVFPVKKRFFCPKRPNLAWNWHFCSFWARPCRLIWCPVGGLVGGCGMRAVSRKTPVYFIVMMISRSLFEWFPLKNGQLPLRERDAFHCRRLSWISYQPTTLFLCFNISPHFSFFHYLTIQGGRNWQPFVGSKNGNKNFQQTRTYNFCVKCVVFARNCKFAKLTQ